MARLQKHYREVVVKQLMKELGYNSIMEVPAIQKITLSMGVKDAVTNKNAITLAAADLEKISGQKPLVTKARKSIAGFKIREGMPLGCKVTLRRHHMYEFLDRLINIVIPRIRDFRGLTVKAFDGYGNYSMGIKEQIVFPEIDYDKIEAIHGLNITITTNAKTNREAAKLLKAFNFPFKDNLDDKK